MKRMGKPNDTVNSMISYNIYHLCIAKPLYLTILVLDWSFVLHAVDMKDHSLPKKGFFENLWVTISYQVIQFYLLSIYLPARHLTYLQRHFQNIDNVARRHSSMVWVCTCCPFVWCRSDKPPQQHTDLICPSPNFLPTTDLCYYYLQQACADPFNTSFLLIKRQMSETLKPFYKWVTCG